MNRKFFNLIFLTLVVFACEKETVIPRDFPRVNTGPVDNINVDGATFQGSILHEGNQGITEWGFVWSRTENPGLGRSDFAIVPYVPGDNSFAYDVKSTLLPDLTYYVRAYAKSATYTTYGTMQSFESKGSHGPTILDFTPKSGSPGDTLRISGSDFSNFVSGNLVAFDTVGTESISASDSLLIVVVPFEISSQKSKISVTVSEKTAFSANYFELSGPVVQDYSPKIGTIGDTITITGMHFSSQPVNKVAFNDVYGEVLHHSENMLKVIVPQELRYSEVITLRVEVAINKTSAKEPFKLSTPTISSVAPATAKIGDTLEISGSNFSWIMDANKVFIEEAECRVIQASKTTLKIVVPDHNPFYNYMISTPRDPSKLTISAAGMLSNVNSQFTYRAPQFISYSPKTGTFLDTITVVGKDFVLFESEWKVTSGQQDIPIFNFSETGYSFRLPKSQDEESFHFTLSTDYYSYYNSFTLLPPEIKSVSPTSVTFGDEVVITGKYFNPVQEQNKVFMNNHPAEIINFSNNSIRVQVPADLDSYDGAVTIRIQTGQSNSLVDDLSGVLRLKFPEVYQITPIEVTYDDEITITGSNFSPTIENNMVIINKVDAVVVSATATELVALVPRNLYTIAGSLNVIVDVGGSRSLMRVEIVGALTLRAPEIYSISPEVINDFDTPLTISGNGFSPGADANYVTYKGIPLQVIDASNDKLVCKIPLDTYYDREESIDLEGLVRVQVGGFDRYSSTTLKIYQDKPWTRITYLSGGLTFRQDVASFSLGSKAYFVGGATPHLSEIFNEVWMFDAPTSGTGKMSDFPGGSRYQMFGASDGIVGYVGFGRNTSQQEQKDIWKYNPTNDTWTKTAVFPGAARVNSLAFTLNNLLYVGAGSSSDNTLLNDLWEYNPGTNTWKKMNNIGLLQGYEGNSVFACAAVNGIVYASLSAYKMVNGVFTRDYIFMKYNSAADSWSKIDDKTYSSEPEANTVIGDSWYFLNSRFSYFNPSKSPPWKTVNTPSNLHQGGTAVTLDGKGYFGFGTDGSWPQDAVLWQYDPSKLP